MQLQAGSDVFVDFEATLGFDDNVARAAENADIEHDGFLTLAGTGGYELYQGESSVLNGKVLLEANQFSRFNGLSNIVAAAKLNYTFGFSSSFGAPWFALDLDYGVVEFESFLRDSNVFRAAATMGMQIDDVTSMRLGFSFKDREAESEVFTTQNASFFINLDWAVLKKHVVYVTYKIETGDIFSSASNPGLWLIDASNSNIVDDDVFLDKRAYRLDGTTQFVTLGYNMIMDLHSSFDLSARYLQSEAKDVSLDYQGLTVLASYFHRFEF
ncbi:MAG: hypothetical protein KAT12_01460 [Gammaproteobacteria bacterium]|nr:hypothetical protein [Gammaproteobacteria bacterium]